MFSIFCFFFFFFQAEDGIRDVPGDWSSDVCSSDLEGKHSLIEPLFSDIDVMVRIENINNIYLAEIQNEDIVEIGRASCRERV